MTQNQNQGWQGDSKGHAKAAKGMSKDQTTGQGWHGDSKGHSKASKGETKDKSMKDKFFGS